jgi:dihydrofolate reductase
MNKPKLIAISAVSIDGVIGVDNEIPWHIPEDFKHFRNTTMGSSIIVGYNTYLTLPEKALEGRRYFVLNGGVYFENRRKNVFQFQSIENMLTASKVMTNTNIIYVAGGAMVYDSLIDQCDEAIITFVDQRISGENLKYFPIDKLNKYFKEIKSTEWLESKNNLMYKIVNYIRI